MWLPRQRVLILLIITSLIFKVFGKSGFWIKTLQNCDPNVNYDLKLNLTINFNENSQYVDGTVLVNSPFDDSILSNASVEILAGNKYAHIISIFERKSCQALHRYFGEFMYDAERYAQLIPGMCPIPKGRYQVHHLLLDYQKMTTLANFPFGNLRFKDVIRKRNNNIYTCIDLEAENYGYF